MDIKENQEEKPMNSDRIPIKTSVLDNVHNQSTDSKLKELKESELSENVDLNLDSD